MSSKALYQTLYQSEHLFRVPTETLVNWGQEPIALVELITVPPVPVVPPVRLPEVPIIVEQVVEVRLPLAPEPEPVSIPQPTEHDLVLPLPRSAERGPVYSQTEDTELLIQDSTPPVRSAGNPKPALIKHKVLLLADEDLSPSDLLFLERILKAVNLDINGVDLLNIYGVSDVDFKTVLRHKYINHFITFGVPFQRINLDIMMDRYHPIRFDGITFLMADSLPVIEASQTLKKLLWNSLKRVFEL